MAPMTVPITRFIPLLNDEPGWLDMVWATVIGAQIVWGGLWCVERCCGLCQSRLHSLLVHIPHRHKTRPSAPPRTCSPRWSSSTSTTMLASSTASPTFSGCRRLLRLGSRKGARHHPRRRALCACIHVVVWVGLGGFESERMPADTHRQSRRRHQAAVRSVHRTGRSRRRELQTEKCQSKASTKSSRSSTKVLRGIRFMYLARDWVVVEGGGAGERFIKPMHQSHQP